MDCVYLVTSAGLLMLWLVLAGGPREFCAGAALVGRQELKWAWSRLIPGLFIQRAPGQANRS